MDNAADYMSYEQIDYVVKQFFSQVVIDLDRLNLLRGREQKVESFISHATKEMVYRVIDAHYEREVKSHEVIWPDGTWQTFKHNHPRLTRLFFRPVRYAMTKFTIFDVLKDIPVKGPRHSLAVMQEIDFVKEWPARSQG